MPSYWVINKARVLCNLLLKYSYGKAGVDYLVHEALLFLMRAMKRIKH